MAFLFMLSGCRFSYDNIEYRRAKNAVEKKDYPLALKHYERVIKRDPEGKISLIAAKEASLISLIDTKQFNLAIKFLEHIVLYSENEVDRREAQEKIAFIYFDKINDYKKALINYSKLLVINLPQSKRVEYKQNIAKSDYYLNDFKQALIEIDDLLKLKLTGQEKFQTLYFQAGIYMAMKKIDEAILVYRGLLKEFPLQAKKEKVGMSIAVAYEDMNDFNKAIDILNEIKPTYPDLQFIDIKIKRLKQRLANLPRAERKSRSSH